MENRAIRRMVDLYGIHISGKEGQVKLDSLDFVESIDKHTDIAKAIVNLKIRAYENVIERCKAGMEVPLPYIEMVKNIPIAEIVNEHLSKASKLNRKMIIGFDFDGTLTTGDEMNGNISEPNIDMIRLCAMYQRSPKFETILWTCREGETLEKIKPFLEKYDLKFTKINEQSDWVLNNYGNTRKLYADVLYDDKAFLGDAITDFMNDEANDLINEFREAVIALGGKPRIFEPKNKDAIAGIKIAFMTGVE